jgi:peptidoglycan/xylan/chitin deacetylase (PgdA/CDA1 family)
MLQRMLMAAVNSAPAGRVISLMERIDPRSSNTLRVLTYHRVADPAKTPWRSPTVTVTPTAFEQQMRMLKNQYCVVSVERVLEAANSGRDLPERAVLLTFDDAYQDFVENALPVLKRYQLPVTLFVPTAFPDHPEKVFWWDQLYAAIQHARSLQEVQTPVGLLPVWTNAQRKQTFRIIRNYVKSQPHEQAMEWVNHFCREVEAPALRGDILSWDDLRMVAAQGVVLGAHTQTHPLMSQLSPAAARAETAGSIYDLRREIGATFPIFAYPSGGYNQDVMNILKEEGIQIAFTTQRGHNNLRNSDRFQLKRINVGPGTSLPLFRAQLLERMKPFIR